MIFDAGSTHTAMYIYKWQADKFNGTGVVSQVSSCTMPGGIGVALRQNPWADAPPYFDRCVKQGLASIPEERRGHSPVFLAATAGMRLVRSENAEQADEILSSVTRALELSAVGMLMSSSSVRVISGQEEGVAGWVSANYLLRTIYPRPTKLVGMLDMGGASTQITFVHRDASGAAGTGSAFDTAVRLYGARHQLYSRSYMCFGQNQLHNRYLVLLVQFDDYVNACSATKFTDEVRRGSGRVESRTPCVTWRTLNLMYTRLSAPKFRNISVTVEGQSDYERCRQRVGTLMNTAHCDRTFTSRDCFVAPPAHPADTNFVAVSGFWYVMDYLGFTKRNPSMSEFTSAVQNWCKNTWSSIKSMYPEDNEEYVSQECFEAEYQSQLLFQGYGIKNDTWKNIDFLKKVNGTSVGWTLGFTILSTNAFPEEQPLEPFPAATFTALMFFLGVCVGVCVTLAISLITRRYCNNNQVNVK
ncbi:hypothetical protein ONE63_009276 [Megalurothrips usitatus]|uniref:Uncharacterized protein n=1 Tax=Megalurothrips usitatus TaxID=439358 RepID=A0AAV7XLQ9_9NEOP|nr:hypothetical protein ONE63_009276 [Megalurothrips usitatus]